jgi:hypothetical protein
MGRSLLARRWMLLDPSFYGPDDVLDFEKIVDILDDEPTERAMQKKAIVVQAPGSARKPVVFATRDITIAVHGFRQCQYFWLAAW